MSLLPEVTRMTSETICMIVSVVIDISDKHRKANRTLPGYSL